jgi:hypothetical protein
LVLGGAIDIGRDFLPVPVKLLGHIRFVVDAECGLAAFKETDQRALETGRCR